MDPLDPLTEIINSGQAFSPLIYLERIIWLIIGFFFIGAISKSIKNSMRDNNLSDKKSIFQNYEDINNKNEGTDQLPSNDK